MTTATTNKLWFTDSLIFIETDTGRVLSQPLRFYPRLARATPAQRSAWTQTPFGLHWPQLDEDISFESFTWDDSPASLCAKAPQPALAFA